MYKGSNLIMKVLLYKYIKGNKELMSTDQELETKQGLDYKIYESYQLKIR